jgi:hypothetical protein
VKTAALAVVATTVGLVAPLAMVIVACGSRTGLLVPGDTIVEPDGNVIDYPPPPPPPVGDDAGYDALPAIDATPQRDASNPVCADASDTLIYAVTTTSQLLRFDPQSYTFSTIGTIHCKDTRAPFSMAVDRTGIAYVLYADYQDTNPGNIFRVSLATASCEPSGFVGGQDGFNSFGMAFSADDTDTAETLYVASDDNASGRLGAVNETTLSLTEVGNFSPDAPASELTGTADGRLFAFFAPQGAGTSSVGMTVAQVDKSNATLIAANYLPSVDEGQAWAFAFWGGNFYLFTAPTGESTVVTRYNPTDGSLTDVASWPYLIDGAGVSTCAPAQ